MAFDAIQICFGELNMRAEDHIMKAVQQVDVNVDKEKLIEAIKSKDFVDELIGYIFAYPDDDYMTMECLCRKLHKHGLIDKKDGEWTTNFIDRKTENSSEIPNNCEEPQYEMGMGTLRCDNCSEYGSFKCTKCDGEMYFKRLEPKDEPQTIRCLNCTYNKDEPQTERSE